MKTIPWRISSSPPKLTEPLLSESRNRLASQVVSEWEPATWMFRPPSPQQMFLRNYFDSDVGDYTDLVASGIAALLGSKGWPTMIVPPWPSGPRRFHIWSLIIGESRDVPSPLEVLAKRAAAIHNALPQLLDDVVRAINWWDGRSAICLTIDVNHKEVGNVSIDLADALRMKLDPADWVLEQGSPETTFMGVEVRLLPRKHRPRKNLFLI